MWEGTEVCLARLLLAVPGVHSGKPHSVNGLRLIEIIVWLEDSFHITALKTYSYFKKVSHFHLVVK